MRFGIAALVLVLATMACKKAPEVSTTSYIIGNSDDIEIVEGKVREEIPQEHLAAAVFLVIRVTESKYKYCSGTIIDGAKPDDTPRVITNHHCFTDDSNSKGAVPRATVPEPCDRVLVHTGFLKGEAENAPVIRCQKGTFRNDYEGDLVVFNLDKKPNVKPAKFWSGAEVPAGRTARIVHHPDIESTSRSSRDNSVGAFPVAQVTRTNCVTVGRFAQAEWGLDKSLGMGIKHTCDQRHGSSGSSLWDVETNTILGVNWGGVVLTYGTNEQSETYNVATRAAYVVAFLEGRNEAEKAEIAMGADLPDSGEKIATAGAKTKNALRTGCGIIGQGQNSPETSLALILTLAFPLLIVFYSAARKKSETRRRPF